MKTYSFPDQTIEANGTISIPIAPLPDEGYVLLSRAFVVAYSSNSWTQFVRYRYLESGDIIIFRNIHPSVQQTGNIYAYFLEFKK